MTDTNGTTGSGTTGAAQVVNLGGKPYKAYTADQVNAKQVVALGVYNDAAGYKQVGTYMRESAEAIERAGMGPACGASDD